MTEDSELWTEYHQSRKAKRARNRDYAATVLDRMGVKYGSGNSGVHLIIEHNNRRFDFWPGTGLWKEYKTSKYYRGLDKLIAELGAK
jgi:hypothetical protein